MKYIGKRISVIRNEQELSIVISSSENKKNAYFRLFWLLAWTACGVIILSLYNSNLREKEKIFIYVFFVFWIYFLLRAAYSFCWKMWGMEIIKIREGKFFVRRAIKATGKILAYETDFIKNIRKRELNPNSIVAAISSADWLENRETLAFDYYGKEIRFGYNLKDDEAKELLKIVKHQMLKS